MSSKTRREITFIVAICVLTSQPCRSVSLGKLEDDGKIQETTAPGWIQLEPQKYKLLSDSKVTMGQPQQSRRTGLKNPGLQLSPFEREALLRKLKENGSHFSLKNLSWSPGKVSKPKDSTTSESENEYQSDFTGFRPVQGEILGVSVDTTHLSEWLAMRPLVHCDGNVMTFTASGGGFTNLLVGRDEGTGISLLNVPSHCGYSVKITWSDLEMAVPYDACYVIQEEGNIVLPLEWWGNPLKLSCPTWRPLPAPAVYCSAYGMLVQIVGQLEDLPTLGFMVNGRWGPLIAEECASLVNSEPDKYLFLIPNSASCVTVEDGVHLWLVIDELEYTLSCPKFTSAPAPSPSDPQFPFFPGPVGPAPTSPPPSSPQAPTQQYFDPYLHPKFPQVYPPGPQPAHPSKPSPASPPGPQPQPSAHLSVPNMLPYFEGEYIKPYNLQPPSLSAPNYNGPQQNFLFPHNLPTPQDPSKMSYSYVPYSESTSKPRPSPLIPNLQHHNLPPFYLQIPYHLSPQTTPAPRPSSGAPGFPMHLVNAFYSPYKDPSYNPHQFSYHTPINLLPSSPTLSPSVGTQTFPEPYQPYFRHCSSYGDVVCTYYPDLYYHPQSPLYPPETALPTPSPPVTSRLIQHYCLEDKILVFLPFAHPDSIRVKDKANTWHFISNVSPFCGYNLHVSDSAGIILSSPLPGCHTYSKSPTSTSWSLHFWDMSLAQYRTVDVHCARQSITPSPFTPSVPPAPPSRPSSRPPSPFEATKPDVFCSTHHMTVKLPAGPNSEIIVKDINGNKIKLQDVPKDCGYSASFGKDGRIHLSLPLHLRCHMTLQGAMYVITVLYTTLDGTKEAQFSCPGVVPSTGQECNLPSEQRLPCGPGSVSQPHCLSMGCCFSKQPPTCYYPMDECTADRHFVFSVPASLTEPPLSPASLVAGGNSSCRPHKVASNYAFFKVPMDGCGARRMQVGKTVIYMLEVNNIVNRIGLNYGTITRDSPIRLLVECRFLPGNTLTVSYLVKTPTLGPAVQTQGAFGVQLRIAKDPEYKSYHPQYHQPLPMLLGKPLYLEVRLLNSPDPSLVLLVHYCVAYPHSGKAVWVLLYNGCPNPLDPDPQQVVLSDPLEPSRAQVRRFTISTFQFLPDGEFTDSNEEIYFMCSTEICSPRDSPCVEGCFGQP